MEIEKRIIMAKAEIIASVNRTAEKFNLKPCIIELVVNGVLSDVRGQAAIIREIEAEKERNKEIEKSEKSREEQIKREVKDSARIDENCEAHKT